MHAKQVNRRIKPLCCSTDPYVQHTGHLASPETLRVLRFPCRLCLEDLESLGALSSIRASIRPAYDAITTSLVARIVELTFSRPAAMTLPATPATEASGPGRSAAAAAEAAGPPTHHNRISALLAERQDTAAVKVATGSLQVRS